MVVVVIVFVVLLLILYIFSAEQSGKRNFDNVSTDMFPEPPKPIDSSEHHDTVKTLIKSKQSCGKCNNLQMILVEDGGKLREQIVQKQAFIKPDLTNYNDYMDCDLCKLLLETWNRYFDVLETLSIFINTGNLPNPPKTVQSKCKGCMENQKKLQAHAKKVREETICLARSDNCKHVPAAVHTYSNDCTDCENMYIIQRLYIIRLVTINNFLRKLVSKAYTHPK
jgi:ubiquitin